MPKIEYLIKKEKPYANTVYTIKNNLKGKDKDYIHNWVFGGIGSLMLLNFKKQIKIIIEYE